MSLIDKYKEQITLEGTKPSNVFLYWKGRVALYALLKAMGVGKGDEVIMPAYTCVVVANAILYLDAIPVYVDISPDSYNMELEKIRVAITDYTKVIICQNTYGLSTDLEEIQEIAKTNDLLTIEDCTHGFGGTYNGIPNGLCCDAAIFSTQWNKPFSTGVGGFSITSNENIARHLTEFESTLVTPSLKEAWNLKILYFVRRYLINEITYWPLVHFYRWLSHNTPVVGSSSAEEINSTVIPKNYFKGFNNAQAKEGMRNLQGFNESLKIRKRNAHVYTAFLKKRKKNHVDEKWFDNHSFLKYPLLVNNRSQFMALAEKKHIELGEWFITPLHPAKGDLKAWGFKMGDFPVAEYLSSHVINLPTSPNNIHKVLSFLEDSSEYII